MIYFEQQIKIINKKTNELKRKSEDDIVDYEKIEERKEGEDITCSICFVNEKKIVFNCGHSTCYDCSENIIKCGECKVNITNRIPLFI